MQRLANLLRAPARLGAGIFIAKREAVTSSTLTANTITCRPARLTEAADAAAVVELLHAYALDPMGGGLGLAPEVRARLAQELARRPTVHCLLACSGEQAVGVAVCIEGFSTFACQSLLNLHDIAVLPRARRQGVGRALLHAAENLARELGCCKLTLEVLSNNHPARALYQSAGFAQYQLDPAAGQALFWQKLLPPAGGASPSPSNSQEP
jgi:ribosomal protein S18 acetylase RimI-like enzyme